MNELNDREKDQRDEDASRDGIGDRGVVSRMSIAVQWIGSVTHGTTVLNVRVKRLPTAYTLF
jgi:hypothetical protein